MRQRKFILLRIFLGALAFLLVMLAGFAHAGKDSQAEEGPRPNIVFIVVDALRADHVSAYGYKRQTTPNLDTLFAGGVRFADATVSAPWTYPSGASLLTGRRPSSIGVHWADTDSELPASEVLLAERLSEAGYYTAGFYSAYWVGGRFGFDQGFDHYVGVPSADPGGGPNAVDVNQRAISWLNDVWAPTNQGTRPLFLFLYYYDPHTWYNPPAPYDLRYDPDYTGTITPERYGHAEEVIAGELELSERDLEHVISLYDGEIAYWDYYLGELVDDLDVLGLIEDSIIVATSDHGQMFGEHGHWLHRNALYEEALRVPLLLRYPEMITTGLTITAPVQTLDVMPTLLEWLELPPPPVIDGHDLTSLIRGTGTPSRTVYAELDPVTDRNDPVYPLTAHYPWYSLRRDGWKYIHHSQTTRPDELYYLAPNSLYETDNLLESEPQRAAAMFADLLETFALPSEFYYLPLVGQW